MLRFQHKIVKFQEVLTMAAGGDPLLILRRSLASNQTPTLHSSEDASTPALSAELFADATHLYFPTSQTSLHLNTPTRFQRKVPEPLAFTLQEIFFAWLLQASATADYIAKCQALGIHHLTFVEKADLTTWLEGGDSSDYIGILPNIAILIAS
jgi:parafibromin